MRLFLSDTFYEAVLSLPKKIQSKVIAFQKKFRENNAANGIHLEPIAQFKDNALRSARVDDNYRAITRMASSDEEREKVVCMASFLRQHRDYTTVPDPYYGDESDFELVITLLEDALEGLIEES